MDFKPDEKLDPLSEALIKQTGERARNLFETRQLMCAEAVLSSLNKGFGGGLTEPLIVAMAAPFGDALGGSGCLCGSLSGGVMATGLILGGERPYRHRSEIREAARQLHDAFKAANGSTCCRILSRKVRHDKNAHFRQCADLTAETAEITARLILEKRPELVVRADRGFPTKRQSKIGGAFLRVIRYFVS